MQATTPALALLTNPAPRRLVLAAALATLLVAGGCADMGRKTPPPDLRIQSVAEWGGAPTALPALPQPITRLTLHHQGEVWKAGTDVPSYLRRLQDWSKNARGWADIPYHYVVAPDGLVYAARPVQIAGDTNTDYDPRGHLLVMLLGNFEEQEPTVAQWHSTVLLMAQTLKQHGLDASVMGAHRHFSSQTVCPGAKLFARFEELRAAVASRSP
jgi:N-acetylmuramoyl-L-alanine amidase